ncbi:21152_t:CDS:2 [Cetraspora pellucida]|uniref:21152_t:CDS:1 n=1 Tax=Cetraspora pellucida TaxID=1433469 RepID=A0A9N9C8A5_9GLOM|nr:21152_t:CDS:2 [Cetraspora pellucida]
MYFFPQFPNACLLNRITDQPVVDASTNNGRILEVFQTGHSFPFSKFSRTHLASCLAYDERTTILSQSCILRFVESIIIKNSKHLTFTKAKAQLKLIIDPDIAANMHVVNLWAANKVFSEFFIFHNFVGSQYSFVSCLTKSPSSISTTITFSLCSSKILLTGELSKSHLHDFRNIFQESTSGLSMLALPLRTSTLPDLNQKVELNNGTSFY